MESVFNFLITEAGPTDPGPILFIAFGGAVLYGLGSLMNWIYKKPVDAFTFTIIIVVVHFSCKLVNWLTK